ncbi:hypothetical protein ACE3MS_17795 [Paenibacillus dendritiformis]|uniref:hypothetical protein n=1 Tax=Paenibacillus dendritiformis TaxID=130049 RepID=UPI00365A9DDC
MFSLTRIRKCCVLAIVLIFVFFSTSGIKVEATSNNDVFTTVDLNNVSVQQSNEGYIKGLDNPELLLGEQKNQILRLLRFTDDEIINMSDSLKNELLKEGGVKVDVNISKMKHIYTDLNGTDHVITEENKEAVSVIRMNDMKKIGLDEITTYDMGSVRDGIFSGGAMITYLGKTSSGKEFKYIYRTIFRWDNRPINFYVDTIGTAWQSHTTRVDYSGLYQYDYGNSIFEPGFSSIDVSSVYGTRGYIDINYHNDGPHYGWLENEVRIPTRHELETGSFASAYGHSWLPVNNVTINIRSTGITFSGFGDKWSWDSTFTIGKGH